VLLDNLLSNALKFRKHGGEVSAISPLAEGQRACLCVVATAP
jgi:hypothetical protein